MTLMSVCLCERDLSSAGNSLCWRGGLVPLISRWLTRDILLLYSTTFSLATSLS